MTTHQTPHLEHALAGHLTSGTRELRDAARRFIPTTASGNWGVRYRRRLAVSDAIVITAVMLVGPTVGTLLSGSTRPIAAAWLGEWGIPVLIAAGWLAALSASRTRDPRIVGVGATEYRRVVDASIVTFALMAVVLALGQLADHIQIYVVTFATGLVALSLSRWSWRMWLGVQRREGRFLSNALVVGSNAEVGYVIGQIERRRRSGYRVIGAATTDPTDDGRLHVGDDSFSLVSDLDNVAAAAARLGVDAVVVVGQSLGDRGYIRQLSWALEGSATELVLASGLTDVAGPRIHFRPVEGLPLMQVELPQFHGGKHIVKRGMDILLAGIGILVLLPLLLAVGIAVRLDSPGPALFRQERVGKNGTPFGMYKFRSMVVDAEQRLQKLMDDNEGSGLLFKMRHDPRVTRLGHILRKYSIDELPQLWNVLTGEMSLVGPRPPLQREVEGYETHVHRRLYIKPGLTGMWQVNGRSDLSWEESVRLDLYYVENWSVTGDLMIMWRTLRVILRGSGAY